VRESFRSSNLLYPWRLDQADTVQEVHDFAKLNEASRKDQRVINVLQPFTQGGDCRVGSQSTVSTFGTTLGSQTMRLIAHPLLRDAAAPGECFDVSR